MGITNNGLNRIRDLLVADIYNAALGTGTVAFATTNTGLGATVASTISTPSVDTSSQQFTTAFQLGSTTAVGTVFAEIGTFVNSAGTVLLSRNTFVPSTHENTEEWNMNTTYFIKRNVV